MGSVRTVSCFLVHLGVQSHILFGGFSPSTLEYRGEKGVKGNRKRDQMTITWYEKEMVSTTYKLIFGSNSQE